MSNNRNRNRNRRPDQSTEPTAAVTGLTGDQDKPFVFKSKLGLIRIPAGTPYIPSARAISVLNRAMQDENEIAALGATFDVITSGFPAEIADTIDLALDELQAFTAAYQRFTGTSIPK